MRAGIALGLLVVLLHAPIAAATDPAYVAPPPSAPIWTVAGGGTAAPAPGRPATDVRLHPREAHALPDGGLVIRDAQFPHEGRLVLVDPAGRIAAVTVPPARPITDAEYSGDRLPVTVVDVDVARDGSVLALVFGTPDVWRFDGGVWTPVAFPGSDAVRAIAALPEGALLALSPGRARWVSRDGAVVADRRLPRSEYGPDEFTQSVTPLFPGGFIAGSGGEAEFALRVPADGPVERLPRLGGDHVGFEGLPDGSALVAAGGPVGRLAPGDVRSRPVYGARPGLGGGDGGPAGDAFVVAAGVSAGPGGALVIAEPKVPPRGLPATLEAREARGRLAVVDDEGTQRYGAVRWVGPPPAGRSFVAVPPAVFRRLASGRVPIRSTIGGEARVVVRRRGEVVADVRAMVPAGDAVVDLGRRLPHSDYAVSATLTTGAQSVTHRVGVSTRRVLALRRGAVAIRRLLDGYGDGDAGSGSSYDARRCRRSGAARITCLLIGQTYDIDGITSEACAGTASAIQRGDGLRIVVRETTWRRCGAARRAG